jgi:glycerol-3-phosphate dehydrogenase
VEVDELPDVEGVSPESRAALAARYGHQAHDVLSIAGERGAWAQPVVPGTPDLLAEAVHAARSEQARTVGDVLLRRTRLAVVAGREVAATGPAVERVAAALAAELEWDAERVRAEIDAWGAEAAAEGVAA